MKYIAYFLVPDIFRIQKTVLRDRQNWKCLTIYLGNTGNAGAGAGRCKFRFQTLHATSQDGSSLESAAATAGRECNIQDAKGRGL